MTHCIWLLVLASALAACSTLNPTPVTPTATRALSGPTLEASPTTDVRPLQVTMAEDDIIGGVGQNIPEAAALVPDSALPPVPEGTPGLIAGSQRVALVMPDGVQLSGDLYEAVVPSGGRAPGVLLIGETIAAWGDFPARLRDAGYTVLVIEGRESAGVSVSDFTVMLRALSEARTVNPGLMAVIGAQAGADAALIGCAVDLLCDTAILISPTARDALLNVMANYNPRPLFVSFSAGDLVAGEIARLLETAATGAFQIAPVSAAGAGAPLLFGAPALTGEIGEWLAAHLVE